MKHGLWFVAVSFLIVPFNAAVSQCSDAGVCSIGHRATERHTELSIEYSFGKSGKTDDLTFHSFNLQGKIPLFDRSHLTIILPYASQSGPLGSVSGIGDLTIFWTQTLFVGSGSQVAAHIGGKIALADVNTQNLPQGYQSGLGTNDLLAGVSYETNEWNLSLGYQFSRGRSDNIVTRLRRGDDLLVSAGYVASISGISLGAEILAIKRIHRSNILNLLSASPLPSYIDVPSSDQMQVNIVGRVAYPLSETLTTYSTLAIPTLKRDVNVDGLTRSLSFSVGLTQSL